MHEHQDSSTPVIRRASPADVSTLSVVGSATYGASYGPLWENSAALPFISRVLLLMSSKSCWTGLMLGCGLRRSMG